MTEISQEKVGDSDLACKIPDIDPFSSSMMQLIDDVKIPSCLHHKSYGKLVNGKIEFLGKLESFMLQKFIFFYPYGFCKVSTTFQIWCMFYHQDAVFSGN